MKVWPFSRGSRETRDFRDSGDSPQLKTTFCSDPFSVPDKRTQTATNRGINNGPEKVSKEKLRREMPNAEGSHCSSALTGLYIKDGRVVLSVEQVIPRATAASALGCVESSATSQCITVGSSDGRTLPCVQMSLQTENISELIWHSIADTDTDKNYLGIVFS